MAIEEVVERSTIMFKKALSLSQAEDVLKFIAIRLPASVSYRATYNNNFLHYKERIIKDRGSVSLGGSIHGPKCRFDMFESVQADEIPKIAGIKFIVIPGYELAEYGKDKITLWDDVRKCVDSYFSMREWF